ncbi:MAG: L-rhamnose/proton symporter RhaT [Saprospiraceae bacterium]|nr:L-rhamnose/proton symporter RhaT [Saprospiraceae bacterium]
MQVLFGILYHTIGGIASGSFYMPFKKVKDWAWEVFWLFGGLFSWLFIPFIAAWLTVPNFSAIIAGADGGVKSFTYAMGLLWGIGGLTYGLGVRYLGMSLGNSVVLGFCSAFGALVPSVYYALVPVEGKTTIVEMAQNTGGQLVLLGVLVCLAGIAITGRAGLLKERELTEAQKTASVQEFSLVKGLVIAVFSGILSSFFNFGIEAGKPMADEAVRQGFNPLFQNNVTYIVLLWGGLTTNAVWCLYLMLKNKTFGDYFKTGAPNGRNALLSALAGTMWFLQFFFYGMGESKLGNGASSWILHMATIILTANLWGLYLKEWQGVSKQTFRTFLLGLGVILVSIFLVGIGNSIN